MTMVKGLGFKVSANNQASPALKQVTGDLDRMRRVTGNTTLANKRMAESLGGSTYRRQVQQAGMQISDFTVQVAGGQSAILAFTQNAPQFLQNFGAMGGVIAATVTILGTFAFMAQRVRRETEEMVGGFLEMENVDLDSIRSGVSSLEQIQKRYNDALTNTGNISQSSARLIIANSEKEFNARKAVLGIEQELLNLRSIDQRNALDAMQREQDQLVEKAREIARTLGPGATADRAAGAGGFAQARFDVEAFREALGDIPERLNLNRRRIKELEAELVRSGIAADEASAAMDMLFNSDPTELIGGINGVTSAVQGLSDVVLDRMARMKIAAGAAPPWAIQDLSDPVHDALAALNKDRASREKDAETTSRNTRDALQSLTKQIKLERELLGATSARARVMRSLGQDASKYTNEQIQAVVGLAEAYELEKEQLDAIIGRTQELSDITRNTLGDAFMSVLDQSKTFGEKMRAILGEVIAELYRVHVVQKLVGSYNATTGRGSGLMGMIGGGGLFGVGGGMFSNIPFFDGGGSTGNSARAGGLDGRGGFLAMMHPRETVIDHTRGGSSGGNVTIVQNNTFESGSDESSIAKALPMIKKVAVDAVEEVNRRKVGGAFA